MKKTILIVILLVVQSSFSQIIITAAQGVVSSKKAVVVPKTTVTIGTQVWTTKNLNVATYSDGTVIPEVTNPSVWTSLTTGAWCYYNNNPANGAIYGKLYNWYAVAGIHDEESKTDASKRKKLAPTGFHVPTDREWTTLTDFLGTSSVAGGKMKETGTTHWLSSNTDATNSSGFSGLPGGYRNYNGEFFRVGNDGNWWTSTMGDTTYSLYRYLRDFDGFAYRYINSITYGFSVRCLRDTASFTVSGAPTNIVATAGDTQASVAFTAPASDGGSAITEYMVTSSPGDLTATGTTSPIVVTGLTNGTSYTFTVVATNAAGNSVASEASNAVTPAGAGVCSANVGGTTKTFMCYNLGVTGTQDALTYQGGNNNGALYQWGRQTDGHEVRTSETQAGPVDEAVASKFITNGTKYPFNWISPQNDSLWLDASKTANDPCPAGFRVPTQAQWGGLFRDGTTYGETSSATRNTWTWTGNGYAVGEKLYLPAAGYRNVGDATLDYVGTDGFYWSSSVIGSFVYSLNFNSGFVDPGSKAHRGFGFSVRCISE